MFVVVGLLVKVQELSDRIRCAFCIITFRLYLSCLLIVIIIKIIKICDSKFYIKNTSFLGTVKLITISPYSLDPLKLHVNTEKLGSARVIFILYHFCSKT